MTRIVTILLAAAALSAPAAPAFAVGVEPCPPDQIGVVVIDAEGEAAEVCVRRSLITDVTDEVGEAVDPIRNCPPKELLPDRIYTYGDYIVIEGGPDDYFRCIQNG